MTFRYAVDVPETGLAALNAQTPVFGISGVVGTEMLAMPERRIVGISGTFTGTLTFEGSINGTDWFGIGAVPSGGGAEVSTATAPGLFTIMRLPPAMRVKMTAYTSGTAVIQFCEVL